MASAQKYASVSIPRESYNEVLAYLGFTSITHFIQVAVEEKIERAKIARGLINQKSKNGSSGLEQFSIKAFYNGKELTWTNKDLHDIALGFRQGLTEEGFEDMLGAWLLYFYRDGVNIDNMQEAISDKTLLEANC